MEQKVHNIIKSLKAMPKNPITGGFVPPYIGNGEIKCVIIGQDPTVRNAEKRESITSTLNLDKPNTPLFRYINDKICPALGISLDNVYATNLFKYFYKYPPQDTVDVLHEHRQPNIDLLKEELSVYPNCPVITLGQPLLQLLVKDGGKKKMVFYWDYNSKTKVSNGNFRHAESDMNYLQRDFFPICHQPSWSRKPFYRTTLKDYLSYVNEHTNINQ